MKTNNLLAIPVYNEQGYVLRVLAKARRYARQILVVDDGSTDQTPHLLAGQSDIEVIRHAENLGYGRSLADAFAFARCRGFDWLITMDCDEQHEPESIPAFVTAIDRDDADIISGSRYLESTPLDDQPPTERREVNRRITSMINDRLGLSITDAFCGFKAYRVSALDRLRITEDGYAMPLQLWAQAVAAHLRICELPVRLVYNDPDRHFGGELDDADIRFEHYVKVFDDALAMIESNQPAQDTARQRPSACNPSSQHVREHGCLSS